MMNNPIIEINDLSVGYRDKIILDDFNVSIYPGEIIGIVGCNGAGKSTLLKTIRGILPRIKGNIRYCGKNIDEINEKEFAKLVGYLQQNVEIGFGYTGKEIVLAGRYPHIKWWESESVEDEKIALGCMEYTGTRHLADRPVNEVSGGQKQRILLAKVIAQQTPILFLDEPTTGLDFVYQEEIFRFAKELAFMGKTVLIVIHELKLAAKYCERILLLGDGQLLADGNPDMVFTEVLLSRAYKANVKVVKDSVGNIIEITTSNISRHNMRSLKNIYG